MAKVITVDVAKCNGCYTCQTVCKDEHVGNDWLPYAKAQPDIGQFWVKLEEHVGGSVPKVRSYYIPKFCNHCEKPACAAACGQSAIYKRGDGLVIIDPAKCTGCGDCLPACPYQSVYLNEDAAICQKCTGCAHLLDAGEKLPRCVEACPTDALGFGEKSDLQDDFITGATVLRPETGCYPQVFYRNIPGIFIAGAVFDPAVMEVIIGARVRATNGGKTWEVVTDDFGDFWFTDLAAGKYDVVIEAKGFAYKTFEKVDATADINLGDIPLSRA
ncbi:MAG: carboxypeptidase regulatory-like domain-containing protein [Clostridiales Family XIII bacterium]|jgi:Fe-S-cluster-containing dehydrogenase component|nr:carboxypeptidase regulatory-like domain-containing protein [Clostridiales Family XIII bacterium]